MGGGGEQGGRDQGGSMLGTEPPGGETVESRRVSFPGLPSLAQSTLGGSMMFPAQQNIKGEFLAVNHVFP